ncbi:MAG TPA: hypothetical protein DCQ31_15340 [Bacteroidales bacterium]|nr:hypothetical protein [Bacteroidales bacterium]
MAAKKILLFVEGEPNSPNGDLRKGLIDLLQKQLKGQLPKIIIGGGYSQGGKTQTVHKFKTNKLNADIALVLVDLDKPENERENDLKELELLDVKDNVFYMIQEMESWFLSQPDVLDKFYGVDKNKKQVSDKIPKKKPADIEHPDEVLKRITENSQKGEYHKIKHAVELLKLLDADKLANDFIDFKNLIEKIKSCV